MSQPSAPFRRATLVVALSTLLITGVFGAPAQAKPRSPLDLKVQTALPEDPTSGKPAAGTPRPSKADKLGAADRQTLAKVDAGGTKSVTTLIATERGAVPSVVRELNALGASIRYRNDKLGYVRAVLPTRAVERAAKLRQVASVDLNKLVPLIDPKPAAAARAAAQAAPGPRTPVSNPYLPINETGAAAFLKAHPRWDGRGVTIGVLDSGVDLDHPALATTSTGERKITDWVTATDPIIDGDDSWRAMLTAVSGPRFTVDDRSYTGPEGDFFFNRFSESVTEGSEYGGDVNRDGDGKDSWGILYRAADRAVWVDTDDDGDFGDEKLMRPYREDHQVGHFGTDNTATAVHEAVPFVVEVRPHVDLTPAGITGNADFVNIGIVAASHGSHVAGIAAGNRLFGGKMTGAAPGATIVSSRACLFTGGCTDTALVEGMIDLVVTRHVDVVNMSIGGLPALNDGETTRGLVYQRLIADYGVQLVFSAGNSGPGLNTVGDPAVVDDVVAAAASVSSASWKANYGSTVATKHGLFNFSSRGPSEDGDLKPSLSAPGSAVSTTPLWQPGDPVPSAGYDLPPGYSMFNGTSMAAPQVTGGAALLLSAARATDVPVTAAKLRTALYSSAKFDPLLPAAGQGAGELRVVQAWEKLRRGTAVPAGRYTIAAPVCTPISNVLATPGRGEGIYNRCAATAGGHRAGQAKTYDVTITRTGGAAGNRTHTLTWLGNDGTFRAPKTVNLPRGRAVTVKVKATPSAGVHSAVLRINDGRTRGIDGWMEATVVASSALPSPVFSRTVEGTVRRAGTRSYFVTVPEGAQNLQVKLSGVAAGARVAFQAFHPYGVEADPTSDIDCYTNVATPDTCNPTTRNYAQPLPGVWELTVQAARTSPFSSNPFSLTAVVQGVTVDPAVATLTSVAAGEPTPVSWTLKNDFAAVTVTPSGGPLGSAFRARPKIQQGEQQAYTLTVPAGATRLEASIGNPSDSSTDLDLFLVRDGAIVAQSADGDSEESVVLANPEPGVYTVVVDGFAVPGTVEYDLLDAYFAKSLGTLDLPAAPVPLVAGARAEVTGTVTAEAVPEEGRQLFGRMLLVEAGGGVVGRAAVVVQEVTGT
jgi:subtilisin family serine protease